MPWFKTLSSECTKERNLYTQRPQTEITKPCKVVIFMLPVVALVALKVITISKPFSCPVKLQVNETATKEFLAMIQKLIEEGNILDQIINFNKAVTYYKQMPGNTCTSKAENHAPRFKAVNDHSAEIFGVNSKLRMINYTHPYLVLQFFVVVSR